ncbi:MAG TPA: hypothetical protein VIL95_02380 [Bacillota bacterium]
MNVRRLAQCYRCRRVFAARGRERFCPDCAAAMRRFRFWTRPAEGWGAVAVFAGLAALLLLQGRPLVPTLLAVGAVALWYLARSGR